MSRNATIRELLCEAPSTVSELAALTGLSVAEVSASLQQLVAIGHIHNSGRFVRDERHVLYEITEKGLAWRLTNRPAPAVERAGR